MIKFFRHIRMRLLSENKFSKYLIYAIGEIILVVIGILIALQINNWNEYKKERELEISILKEIAKNLEQDLIKINDGIEVLTFYRDNTLKVYNHLEQKTLLTDSLKHAYSYYLGGRRFNGASMGFENLKSAGINIIKNDSLKSSIVELYNFYLERLTNVQDVFEDVESLSMKQRILKLKKRDGFVEPLNILTLYNDNEFIETIQFLAIIKTFQLDRFITTKEEVNKTLNMIYEELKKKQ